MQQVVKLSRAYYWHPPQVTQIHQTGATHFHPKRHLRHMNNPHAITMPPTLFSAKAPFANETHNSQGPECKGGSSESKGCVELLLVRISEWELLLHLTHPTIHFLAIRNRNASLILSKGAALVRDHIIILSSALDGVTLNHPSRSIICHLEHFNASKRHITDACGDRCETKLLTFFNLIIVIECLLKEGLEKRLLRRGINEGEVLADIEVGHGNNGPGPLAGLVQQLDIPKICIGAPRNPRCRVPNPTLL
mmetsp:Transcript_38681/g.78901  ORF Transcript_38681/g.78901 Transcript_38681/m.78901 type:complete len:250 (+) Transcript_38681:85-834(+)